MPQLIDIRHKIKVYVAPAPAIGFDEEHVAFGAYQWGRNRIWMAGIAPKEIGERYHFRFFAETLIHELVHYEQWRDGRNATERGVQVRSRNLARKARRLIATR